MKVEIQLNAADTIQNREHASQIVTDLLRYLGAQNVKPFVDDDGSVLVFADVLQFHEWTNRLSIHCDEEHREAA